VVSVAEGLSLLVGEKSQRAEEDRRKSWHLREKSLPSEAFSFPAAFFRRAFFSSDMRDSAKNVIFSVFFSDAKHAFAIMIHGQLSDPLLLDGRVANQDCHDHIDDLFTDLGHVLSLFLIGALLT